jgi:hypothetical protein
MSDALQQNRKVAIVLEVTEGVTPAITNADYIEPQDGFSTESTTEALERSLLSGNRKPKAPVFGAEESSVSIPVEAASSLTPGIAPKHAELLEAFGFNKTVVSEKILLAGSTPNVLNLASTTGLAVGQVVKVSQQFRTIVSLITDTSVTLDYDLSIAPASGVKVRASTQYQISESVDKTVSVLHEISDTVRETIRGCRVQTIGFENASTGQIANWLFALVGLSRFEDVLGSPSGSVPAFDNGSPSPILGAILSADGVDQCVSEFSASYEQTVAFKSCMRQLSGKEKSRGTENFNISGAMNPYKPDDSIPYKVGTQISLLFSMGQPQLGGGTEQNICLYFPKVVVISVALANTEGTLVDQISWQAVVESDSDYPVISYID